MADEEDEDMEGLYEDGHWVWDNYMNGLFYVSDRPPQIVDTVKIPTKVLTGAHDFKDDIDLLEQVSTVVDKSYELRFRKRYARKVEPGQADVITLQDVKDLVLYTAPVELLSTELINLLHLPTTERLLRALILYCQYYLQIADEMTTRKKDFETKLRIPECDIIEATFSENLCDLRTLVAKEYSILLVGGADTKKFHHMGSQKKKRSLSDRDTRLIETLLRMCIQIVWLALSRRSFNKIEVEINRIFKSDTFNSAEHMLHTNYIAQMSKEEYKVLLGGCVRHDRKLNTCSPLMNEAFCHRSIDYQMMGLGTIEYERLPPRLRYMLLALAGAEEDLMAYGISCGILGLPRSLFDTMLHVIPTLDPKKSKTSLSSTSSSKKGLAKQSTTTGRTRSSTSRSTTKHGVKVERPYIYKDIILPEKEEHESPLPSFFPDKPADAKPCNEVQRKRWQLRLFNLRHPSRRKTLGGRRSTTLYGRDSYARISHVT